MKRLFWLVVLIPFWSLSQERCGVNAEYFKKRSESTLQFENWLSEIKIEKRQQFSTQSTKESTYVIPVVFHVIHRGESIGTGVNLSEERILEQLQILNEDFRRLNPDTISTPDEFLPVAADTRIQFVMAKRDPEGLPTNGIVRKQGSLNSYRYSSQFPAQSDELVLKAESYWPAEHYLNFWIADLTAPTLGYSSFPFSNLEGISEIWNNEFVDGVVVDYRFIGINENTGTFESFGRTATHELGHFFGLRHVSGDGGCSVDDFCDDTPNQSTLYGGQCPSSPRFSCESSDMYSNYLNYTDDACMNVFTLDQKERMRIVLENSPRRTSLLTSPALLDPVITANDVGIKTILSPGNDDCTSAVTPAIEIRNYGTDTISTFDVVLSLNSVVLQTVTRNIEIAPLETSVVNFNSITLNPSQSYDFTFTITSVNNTIDENLENNIKSVEIYPVENQILPYSIDFESQSDLELRTESGGSSAWEVVEAPFETATNQAIALDFYNDSSRFGEKDYLITPVFDLSSLNSAELFFRYSYSGRITGSTKDGLIVAISTDCGNTFKPTDYVFEAYGNTLSTTGATDEPFSPTIDSDWREVNINLTAYTGYDNIKIAFIGQNGLGNFLYLDDILITSNSLKAYDLGIKTVKNLPVITCDDIIIPTVEIKNHGFETVSSYDLNYELIGQLRGGDKLFGEIISGDVKDFSLEFENLQEGEYDLRFTISNPNGNQDEFDENNTLTYHFVVDNNEDGLPLRENFEEDTDWVITNTTNDPIWDYTKLGSNTVLKASGYSETEIGTEHWLITPKLLMEDLDSASMEFSYAYAGRPKRSDRLRILLSVNCGKDFQYTLFDKSSADLSEIVTNDPFVPVDDTVWVTESINLNEFVVWQDIRIAFVFTNGNGNNLFLDDIEFFTQASPPELRFEENFTFYPNPAKDFFKVSLNLPEKEEINISLIDMSGKLIFTKDFPNALNQELVFDTPAFDGFYLLRVTGKSFNISKRILIKQ